MIRFIAIRNPSPEQIVVELKNRKAELSAEQKLEFDTLFASLLSSGELRQRVHDAIRARHPAPAREVRRRLQLVH